MSAPSQGADLNRSSCRVRARRPDAEQGAAGRRRHPRRRED